MIEKVDAGRTASVNGAQIACSGDAAGEPCAGCRNCPRFFRGSVALSRDALAGNVKRQVLCFRSSPAILDYVNGAELENYSQRGVVTPDHTIRTKNWPLLVPAPEAGRLDGWAREVESAVARFVSHYHDYFARNNARAEPRKTELDPLPRVALVPGIGLFGLGASAKEAAIAADIAENTVEVIADFAAIGRYQPISEADMFDVEYWSLEQAKLGKAAEKPLARQIAIVTGGLAGQGRLDDRETAHGEGPRVYRRRQPAKCVKLVMGGKGRRWSKRAGTLSR